MTSLPSTHATACTTKFASSDLLRYTGTSDTAVIPCLATIPCRLAVPGHWHMERISTSSTSTHASALSSAPPPRVPRAGVAAHAHTAPAGTVSGTSRSQSERETSAARHTEPRRKTPSSQHAVASALAPENQQSSTNSEQSVVGETALGNRRSSVRRSCPSIPNADEQSPPRANKSCTRAKRLRESLSTRPSGSDHEVASSDAAPVAACESATQHATASSLPVPPMQTPQTTHCALSTAALAIILQLFPKLQVYIDRLCGMHNTTFAPFEGAYAGTFEVKDAVVPWNVLATRWASSRLQAARGHDTPPAMADIVCLVARTLGVDCIGVAPQHQRRGVYVVAPEDDRIRVYAGPERLPQCPAQVWTVYKTEL